MASYRPKNGTKPWFARRKRDGIEYSLGYHATKAEAEEAERQFDAEFPSDSGGWHRGGRRVA